jgi:hypothetical protein
VGRIKSALEIAMERTEAVKSDKGSIDQFEAKQRGKKLANKFLESAAGGGNAVSLEQEIKKAPTEQRSAFRQGIFDVLLSQIALPLSPEDEKRVEEAGKGLQAVAQKYAPPAHATILLSLEGTFAAIGGVLILSEPLGTWTLLGFILMLFGMFATQWDLIAGKKGS